MWKEIMLTHTQCKITDVSPSSSFSCIKFPKGEETNIALIKHFISWFVVKIALMFALKRNTWIFPLKICND